MCRRKLQAKQMRTRLVWHRYWLTESRNCSGLSDRKTGLECQAEGTMKEKLVGRLVDWLMEGWDKTGRPYHVWSSVTSSPSSYILKKKKKKRSQGEKQASFHQDDRGGGRGCADRYVADSDDDHLSSAPHTPHCPAEWHAAGRTRACTPIGRAAGEMNCKNMYFSSFR